MVRQYNEKKKIYMNHMNELLKSYRRLVFCCVDNVQSQQMHKIRKSLRGKGEILMGKNTLMRKTIRTRADSENSTMLDKYLLEKVVNEGSLVGNLGIIFTNEKFEAIQEVIKENRIQAPARVGAVSPLDVVVPAGNTGLEPGATTFFQALQINTKIVKGSVEILTEKKVLTEGDKVDNSTAVLLQKLKIKPFYYGLDIRYVFDEGEVYEASILELKDDFFRSTIEAVGHRLTCLSLGLNIPTPLSIPHIMTQAFNNLLSVSLCSGYTFQEFDGDKIVDAIKSGKILKKEGATVSTDAASESLNIKESLPAEEDEEEDEDMGFGLFD